MTGKEIVKKCRLDGISYDRYLERTRRKLNGDNEIELTELEIQNSGYNKLNFQRTNRIHKTYKPDDELRGMIAGIDQPQVWIIITEDWCGDSAQNVPYIMELSECNPNIEVLILRRDTNPDLMDIFFPDGRSRGIPKLIAFDEEGNRLFEWGPRPLEIQESVQRWIGEGMGKEERNRKIHHWYAINKGRNLIAEFRGIIERLTCPVR